MGARDMASTVIDAAARFAAVTKTEAATSAVILDAGGRFAVRRQRVRKERRERQRVRKERREAEDREFVAFCRRFPEPVVVAIVTAVCDNSEEPLRRLPAQWRERAIAAFRASK